ncbi:autotransporter outer membrane beta-barrel domain-containing protein [uncultured Cetobacterium sp.]|uniref:autotransporter outer membrane beta-barrel domain-containing protein n=1 Tax=uncultured Cetobacterium sp. TaxID=527638 RepID=UPI002602DC37|nr:autotransporter outer membrane beta-barrel domain-containing protein [uncultured Cetobacterium sp.]
MKEKLLLISLIGILGSINSYGVKYPYKQLKDEVIEKSAYKDMLKIINEIDRQKGKEGKVIVEDDDKSEANVGELNIVPIAQYTGIGTPTEDLTKITGGYDKNDFITLNNVYENLEIKSGEKNREIKGNIDKTKSIELPYVHKGSIKRFYFGNGNTINNIIFTNSKEFNKRKEKEKNNTNYSIEGEYKSLKNKKNSDYRMSVDDYEKNIKNKSREDILLFLQKKLKENNKDTIVKKGDLFIRENGKDWKVLWSLEPISTREYDGLGIKDIINTKIYVYEPYEDQVEQNRGKVLLTNSKDIYLEDKVNSKERFRINNSEYKKQINELEKDKMELSEKEFNDKWVKPFEKNGKYEKEIIDFKDNIVKLKKEIEDLSNEKEEITNKFADRYLKYSIFKNYYDPFSGINENKMKTLSKEEEKLARKYAEVAIDLKKNEIKLKKGNGEWKDKVVAAKDLAIVKIGKKIEFRGNGRVDGIIDLGDGYNVLEIQQQGTGKYGTNIILGPYAELHNINEIIAAGGQVASEKQPSISGKNSLALDIDKTKRNKNGELYQHVFRKSDKNIAFTNPSSMRGKLLGEENFGVELMVSKLDKDEIINMGRDLQYKSRNLDSYSNWKDEPYVVGKLRVDSDSIAHEIKELPQKDENGNTLLSIKLKNNIKGLNENENIVYQSIKNSNSLGSLAETLTFTNKKTLNGGIREAESLKELKILLNELRENNIYSKLNKVAKDQIDIFSTIPFNNGQIFDNKDKMAVGGYLSTRVVEGEFKGTINSGYGIYNVKLNDTLRGGFVFGGGSSSYSEIKNNKLDKISTDSKIKGQSMYLGAYGDKKLSNNLKMISGLGIQYGEYKIQRKWENNYQKFDFQGKSKTNSGNLYTGLIYNYKISDGMELGVKGTLTYTVINQGKVEENNKLLGMEVAKENFDYLDGEFGIDLSKKLYGKESVNRLKGGLYGTYGLVGYENKNLVGKINNSSSSFEILGDKERKYGIKLSLNYDVERKNGILYGIEGNYKTNTESNEITMGLKIGYIF